jgi:hypothetical protein
MEDDPDNCDYLCMTYESMGCLDVDKEWKQATKNMNKPTELY